MYTISKQFEFEASHRLRGMPAGHQCGRHHGHSYVIEVELQAREVDVTGFVRDFGELRDVKLFVDTFLDHRHLNDDEVVNALALADPFAWNPTAENLARALYDTFKKSYPQLTAVRVSETRKTWASYRPSLGLEELSQLALDRP